MNSRKISILTYNAGLLRIKIPLYGDWVFTPYVHERLNALPQQIKGCGADIVAIQEIYEHPHQKFLINALKTQYPYNARTTKKRILNLNSDGLLILSKHPLTNISFHSFRRSFLLERIFVKKGFLAVDISLNTHEKLKFINTHLTAGGIKHPESIKTDAIREKQILQLQQFTQCTKTPCVMLGDFNTGMATLKGKRIYVSENNYHTLESEGWKSAMTIASRVYPENENEQITWDARNGLNINSPHGKRQESPSPSQLIDHIFFNRQAKNKYRIETAKIIFQENTVEVKNSSELVTCSDHYGLLITVSNRS